MKRALLIGLALGFVVAMAVPAFAIDWTAGGFIDVYGAWNENTPLWMPQTIGANWEPPSTVPVASGVYSPPWFGVPMSTYALATGQWPSAPYIFNMPMGWFAGHFTPYLNHSQSGVFESVNLEITARASENAFGVLGFCMFGQYGSESYQQANSAARGQWANGTHPEDALNAWYSDFGNANAALLVTQAYMNFKVPYLPARLIIGQQPIIERPTVFMFYNGPGVSMPITIDPLKLVITPAWYRMWQGNNTWSATTADTFAADIHLPIGSINVGTFAWWERFQTWGNLGVSYVSSPPFESYYDVGKANFWWFGLYSDGKIGPISYSADFIDEGGHINYAQGDVFPTAWEEFVSNTGVAYTYIKSFLARAEVDANVVKKLMFGAGMFYTPGLNKRDNWTGTEFTVPNEAENVYGGLAPGSATSLLGVNGMPMMQDFLLLSGGFMGMVPAMGPEFSTMVGPNDYAGFWYARGFAQYMAADWLRLAVNCGYIGDTTRYGNTFGNAVNNAPGAAGINLWAISPVVRNFSYQNYPQANPINWTGGTWRHDNFMGVELDIGANVSIYKNVNAGIAFGYMFGGPALDQYNVTPGAPVQLNNGTMVMVPGFNNYHPQNPYGVLLGVAYFF